MSNITSNRIYSDSFQGKNVYRLDLNNNHKPDGSEPILVERDGDSWKPMEKLDGPVNRFDVENKIGFWTDKQVSHKEGWFWNRKEVIDRPKDGKIDNDEVETCGFNRVGNGLNGPNKYELGAEISADQTGALYLDQHSQRYGDRYIVGQGDIKQMEQYRQDDAHWNVATQPKSSEPVLIGSAQGPFVITGSGTTITVPLDKPL